MQKKPTISGDEADSLSESDVEFNAKITPRAERPGRRAASKKINYSGLLDSDLSDTDDEMVLKDNDAVKDTSVIQSKLSDDDFQAADSADLSDDEPIKKKTVSAKRPHKKAISSDSDSDKKVNNRFDISARLQLMIIFLNLQKKKKIVSSDEDFDSDFE